MKTIINKIKQLFINRDDVYALQIQNGNYIKIDKPITDEVLLKHLTGQITIGIYQLNKANEVKWVCYDFDVKGVENANRLLRYLLQKPYSNSILLEYTGGRGYHLWIFFKPIQAKVARRLFMQIGNKIINGIYELFPKQEELENDGYGNLVKLPLGIHRKYGKWSEIIYPSTLEEIKPVEIPQDVIDYILLNEVYEEIEKEFKIRTYGWWNKCIVYQRILKGVPEGHRDESAFLLARIYRDMGLPKEQALLLLKDWNKNNLPPLDLKTLKIKIRQAYSKKYSVGFRSIVKNSVLNVFCPPNCYNCIYRRQEKVKKLENIINKKLKEVI